MSPQQLGCSRESAKQPFFTQGQPPEHELAKHSDMHENLLIAIEQGAQRGLDPRSALSREEAPPHGRVDEHRGHERRLRTGSSSGSFPQSAFRRRRASRSRMSLRPSAIERERARVEHMWYTWSMSTKKPRVNVVLEPSAYDRLGELAKGSGESRSEIVRRFVGQMLDVVEDAELARLAVARRKSLARKRTLSHEAVWGSRRSASRSG